MCATPDLGELLKLIEFLQGRMTTFKGAVPLQYQHRKVRDQMLGVFPVQSLHATTKHTCLKHVIHQDLVWHGGSSSTRDLTERGTKGSSALWPGGHAKQLHLDCIQELTS